MAPYPRLCEFFSGAAELALAPATLDAAAIGMKRKHGGIVITFPQTFDTKRARVPLLDSDDVLEGYDSIKKWLDHFRVESYVPPSWESADIIGKLVIWSFRAPGAALTCDCAVVRAFDMKRQKATLQQVYPPYHNLNVTSADWKLNPAHFVRDGAEAIAPLDLTILPWLFANYPDRPCKKFCKEQLEEAD